MKTADDEQRRFRLREALATLSTQPPDPRVRIALAEAEFRLAVMPDTSAEEAIERLRTAVSHDPFLPKLYLHLGRQLHRLGRHGAAVSEYRRALQLAPSSRRAHQLLALALLELDKPEQAIGQALVKALNQGSSEGLRAAVAELDERAEELRRADPPQVGGKSPTSKPNRKRAGTRKARTANGDMDPNRWPDTWRLALIEQLSRSKPLPAQLATQLDTGAAQIHTGGGVTEYATACVLMVLSGEPSGAVRRRMTAAGIDEESRHPAVDMLAAVLDLVDSDDPAAFVAAATDRLARGLLPLELVCLLHFTKYGSNTGLAATEAVQFLDAYPEDVRDLDCFRELRLAVLDDQARKAWAGERFAEAKLLWREMSSLDPYRVPVAVNLALLAARTKAESEYRSAWERLPELMYLRAAGIGDVQVLLDERMSLHLALSQQGRQRHCAPTTQQGPSDEEIAHWVDDPEALEVWLREWDLYYLNARLHFRSPTHLLGVARDSDDKEFESARDTLAEHIENALQGKAWAGVEVFHELALTAVREAFDHAVEPIERARDPYLESEQSKADELADELLFQRALLLRNLIIELVKRESAGNIALGCSMARHQFLLPRVVLEPLSVAKGILPEDGPKLFTLFENDLIALATQWRNPPPRTSAEWSRRLAALDECVAVLPHRIELLEQRAGLLYEADRYQDAYSAALDALEKMSSAVEPDDTGSLRVRRANLVTLIDNVGFLAIPERHRQPNDLESAKAAVTAMRDALRKFPRSAALRMSLANLLAQLDEVDLGTNGYPVNQSPWMAEAVRLLSEGIDSALSNEQRKEFETRLRSVRQASATTTTRRHVQRLAEDAFDRVRKEVEQLQRQPLPHARQQVLLVVNSAKAEVTRLLTEYGPVLSPEQVQSLEHILAQFDSLARQLGSDGS